MHLGRRIEAVEHDTIRNPLFISIVLHCCLATELTFVGCHLELVCSYSDSHVNHQTEGVPSLRFPGVSPALPPFLFSSFSSLLLRLLLHDRLFFSLSFARTRPIIVYQALITPIHLIHISQLSDLCLNV